jgi:hypothetical protein
VLFSWDERSWLNGLRAFAGVCGLLAAIALPTFARAADQPVNDAVGVIEGEDISVTGPMSVEVVGGLTKTILRSGSDVRVKSGQARISLVEGGQISICGPAHLSVLKSGGSLMVALESGVIHARLEADPAVTIYTPAIQALPVAIGNDPRELLLGFESPGVMCIRSYRGAMRLEQQFSGQSVMVPQGGDVLVTNGQIDALQGGAGHCNCELQIAKAPRVPPPGSAKAITTAETSEREADANSNAAPQTEEKTSAQEEPIYHVDLPPLRYDASARVQPEPDPRLMVIVRRVRVRSALVFHGRVQGEPVATVAVAQPPAVTAPAHTPPAAQGSVVDRVRSFFRRLWTRGV